MTTKTPANLASKPLVPAEVETRRTVSAGVRTRKRTGGAGGLVVACILDEFSFDSFGPEADFAPLTMENWKIELTAIQPDILFVESAWRGFEGSWWNTVAQHGPELSGIVEWCRHRSIPTVFWNKEDPVHFNTFLTTASMFDYVLTTDVDCVPKYKNELGHDRVHFMPFAAQPCMTNPLEEFSRFKATAFAGAFYERYPERIENLRQLTEALKSDGDRVDIYDRNFGQNSPGYEFPEEYEDLIVGGGLGPDQIGVPYKAYTRNLNLNSVKQSQSMFARRVFELMASNTLVLSNYSRGMRMMFGDLTISTDSGKELLRRLRELENIPNGENRIRAMALRKVLNEHTYRSRLEFIAEICGLPISSAETESVAMIAFPKTGDEFRYLTNLVNDQSHLNLVCIVVGGDYDQPPGNRYYTADNVEDALGVVDNLGADFVGVFDLEDYYGPDYVHDLVLNHRWVDACSVGHAEYFQADDSVSASVSLEGEGRSYTPQGGLLFKSSIARTCRLDEWEFDWTEPGILSARGPGFSVGTTEYLSGGRKLSTESRKCAAGLCIDIGKSLVEMREFADSLRERHVDRGSLQSFDLRPLISSRTADERIHIASDASGHFSISSYMPSGVHTYVNFLKDIPCGQLFEVGQRTVFFDTSPGLDCLLVVYYLDEHARRLSHEFVSQRTNCVLSLPSGCAQVRFGLRVSGSGYAQVRGVYLEEVDSTSHPVLTRSDTLVITNIYPSYSDLYRNGFIHSRTRAYIERGHRTEVLRLQNQGDAQFAEFENIDTGWIDTQGLGSTLDKGNVKNVLVHFLNREMWHLLEGRANLDKVLVWIHGAEVQPWWRRKYNYANAEELEAAKPASDDRLALWRDVFANAPNNFHFVFVSQYFADEVFEDVGIRLDRDRYSIMHNPIDSEIFDYIPKPVEQSRKVLTIRPFASAKYANDLSVKAILSLRERPGFESIHFRIVGEGRLFEATVAPLLDFPNVRIDRGFLDHDEISRLHKDYGVFLTPTRMDAQGVSRDEAMSSGLVPVTSSVAAVPEFVDDTCGFLGAPESWEDLADAVWALAHDQSRFTRMSQAAASRVRAQSASNVIIPKELRMIFGS